jgi:putative DNA primase/helicase
LFDRLARVDAQAIGAEQGEYDRIPFLRFEKDAQAIFDEWRTDLERRIRSGDYPPAFEAHLAKYRSLVPSLALLFHLVEDDLSGAVGVEPLLRALAWSQYLESHAHRIYGYAGQNDAAVARDLHKHIVNGDLGRTFTARDVYRNCWRLLDKDNTSRAIGYLSDYGYIREQKVVQSTGRPKITYEVNPALRLKEKSKNALSGD